MEYFTYNDKHYSYIKYQDLTTKDLPRRKTYKQSKFLDFGCGFDIETSKVPDEKLSFMYIWQFSIDYLTIIGRTWEEFTELLNMLSKFYKLSKNVKLLVFVHNFSFEFSFIKRQLEWQEGSLFAMDKRKIVKATTKNFIEFRDSMLLTNMSLEKLAKNFNTGLEKLKGDLDYSVLRFSDTELTNEELAYCINDVQILQRFYHSYVKEEFVSKQLKIPLTSTGVVRDELKRNFKHLPKKERTKLQKLLQRSQPDEKLYKVMIEWLYRGGFVHSNVMMAARTLTLNDFRGVDEKSAYPAIALQEKVPYGFTQRTPLWWYMNKDNKRYLKDNAYIVTLRFKNIRTITNHTLESKNKIYEMSQDATFDNGRLIKASSITVVLNEIDFECYQLMYTWDNVECLTCHSAIKKELPEYVKDLFLKYFSLKEELPDGYERNKVKAKVNSLYGMMVTRLYSMDYSFNEELGVFDEVTTDKSYEELTKDLILLPQWGIWITSIARRRLLGLVVKFGDDDLYNDTDSCKIQNYIGNKWAIDSHNDRIRRINKTMYVGQYKRELFKDLGCFEDEGKMFYFRCLGAKRYMYTKIKKGKLYTEVVVAGMRKGALQKYCKDNDLNIYEEFKDGLTLDTEDADKLTTAYNDVEFTRTIQCHIVSEKSCVTLYNIPFSMSMSKEYLKYISFVQQRNSRDYVNRRY